jgi:hypothetical protein
MRDTQYEMEVTGLAETQLALMKRVKIMLGGRRIEKHVQQILQIRSPGMYEALVKAGVKKGDRVLVEARTLGDGRSELVSFEAVSPRAA